MRCDGHLLLPHDAADAGREVVGGRQEQDTERILVSGSYLYEGEVYDNHETENQRSLGHTKYIDFLI